MEGRAEELMSMSYEYTVKVYADTVRGGMRTLESIPDPYHDDVKRILDNEEYKKERLRNRFLYL